MREVVNKFVDRGGYHDGSDVVGGVKEVVTTDKCSELGECHLACCC